MIYIYIYIYSVTTTKYKKMVFGISIPYNEVTMVNILIKTFDGHAIGSILKDHSIIINVHLSHSAEDTMFHLIRLSI